jgi:dTMP kinase
MTRGRFITLEGLEGAGKSTQIATVQAIVARSGLEVVVTREPGGTPMAERIREMTLSPREEKVPPLAELLLMFAARCLHLDGLVRPALARGAWVICDRFTDASIAYQGGGRGLPLELIRTLAEAAHGDLWPDLTLLLDLDPAVGLARAGRRGSADRFEREELEFFGRVRASYLALAKEAPERVAVIDAGRPANEIAGDVEQHVRRLLRNHGR